MASRNSGCFFIFLSVGFTCYLLSLFIAWFCVIAIDDSTLYYPWLNDCIEEILEIVFLSWVLITFRARKFNTVALQTENMRGGGLASWQPLAGVDYTAASEPFELDGSGLVIPTPLIFDIAE